MILRLLLAALVATLCVAGIHGALTINERAPIILTTTPHAKIEGIEDADILCLTGLAFIQTKNNLRQVVNPDGSAVTCSSI